MSEEPYYVGRWGNIVLATVDGGGCPAYDFLSALNTSDKAKIFVLLKKAADVGPNNINNREKFKKIEGSLFEFKSFQIRMPCFYSGRSLVITHGFIKKQAAIPKSEIKLAKRIKGEHEANKLNK